MGTYLRPAWSRMILDALLIEHTSKHSPKIAIETGADPNDVDQSCLTRSCIWTSEIMEVIKERASSENCERSSDPGCVIVSEVRSKGVSLRLQMMNPTSVL